MKVRKRLQQVLLHGLTNGDKGVICAVLLVMCIVVTNLKNVFELVITTETMSFAGHVNLIGMFAMICSFGIVFVVQYLSTKKLLEKLILGATYLALVFLIVLSCTLWVKISESISQKQNDHLGHPSHLRESKVNLHILDPQNNLKKLQVNPFEVTEVGKGVDPPANE
jgi:amino acid transporter